MRTQTVTLAVCKDSFISSYPCWIFSFTDLHSLTSFLHFTLHPALRWTLYFTRYLIHILLGISMGQDSDHNLQCLAPEHKPWVPDLRRQSALDSLLSHLQRLSLIKSLCNCNGWNNPLFLEISKDSLKSFKVGFILKRTATSWDRDCIMSNMPLLVCFNAGFSRI